MQEKMLLHFVMGKSPVEFEERNKKPPAMRVERHVSL